MRTLDVASSFHRTAELKQPCPDPLIACHCTVGELVCSNSSTRRVQLLRDTGALQSLVCSRVSTDGDL